MKKGLIKKSMLMAITVGMLSAGTIVNAEEGYVVKDGDNLQKIAKEIYGDSSAWKMIYEANKASIKNPNIIYKGQVLNIPNGTGETSSIPENVPIIYEQPQIETTPVSQQEIPINDEQSQTVTQQDWFNSLYDAIHATRINGDMETVRAILGNVNNINAQYAERNVNPIILEDGKALDFYFSGYGTIEISANRLDVPLDEGGNSWWWTIEVITNADGSITINDAYDSM